MRDALGFFDTTRSEVITGQFLDVSVQARGDSDVEQAMRVLRYKSAKYSVERPLHVGAALAGAEPGLLEALTGFGLPLGEAFQLRDDLLGVFGDPEVTGKPAGDDLTEGKRTVLVALALGSARAATTRSRSTTALGAALTLEEVAELRRIIDESGAHAEVERRIDELTARSLAALDERAPVTDVGPRGAARRWRRPRPSARSEPARRSVPWRAARARRACGPSPRSSAANLQPRSAFARPPSTLSATWNACSSWRASGLQPSQSSTTPSRVVGVDVARQSDSASKLAPAVVVGRRTRAPRP